MPLTETEKARCVVAQHNRRERLKEQGLCQQCGRHPAVTGRSGKKYACRDCLDYLARKRREGLAKRRAGIPPRQVMHHEQVLDFLNLLRYFIGKGRNMLTEA